MVDRRLLFGRRVRISRTPSEAPYGHLSQCFLHKGLPNDSRCHTTGHAVQVTDTVIPDPHAGNQIRCITDEPCIMIVARRASLSCGRTPNVGARTRSAPNDIFKHRRQCRRIVC